MPDISSKTKRPRGALLQSDIGLSVCVCRIGGRLRSLDASRGGVTVEIPPLLSLDSNLCHYLVWGQCLMGSLTGAVASQRVTEAFKGSLAPNGNRCDSAIVYGSLTARPISQADAKAGYSDPTVAHGCAEAQQIKVTPGITGLSGPRVHIDDPVWHLKTLGCYRSDSVPKIWLITVEPNRSSSGKIMVYSLHHHPGLVQDWII